MSRIVNFGKFPKNQKYSGDGTSKKSPDHR